MLKIYKLKNTVFSISELNLLFNNTKSENLKAKLNYYVKKGDLVNPRKGIYAKSKYNPLELPAKIYNPAYISLETVLQKNGVIFQNYKTIFAISYLTRKISTAKHQIQYRKIKQDILLNPQGIIQKQNYAIASKERAFLDALYLYKDYHFDNLAILDKKEVYKLLLIYNSQKLSQRVKKILKNA